MIRRGITISVILIIIMLGVSFWIMPLLPADGQFATHWGLNGEADRYGSRNTVLWFMPALGSGMAVLLTILPSIDPRRRNLLRSSLPYLVVWIGTFIVLTFAHMMMVLHAAGIIDVKGLTDGPGLLRWVVVLVGGFMTILGAVMGKMRPNWFMGIRTPWTLSSDLSWDKTHRLAGWLFMLTGLVSVVTVFVLTPRIALIMLVGSVMISAVIAVAYSFLIWRNDPARETLVPEEAD